MGLSVGVFEFLWYYVLCTMTISGLDGVDKISGGLWKEGCPLTSSDLDQRRS